MRRAITTQWAIQHAPRVTWLGLEHWTRQPSGRRAIRVHVPNEISCVSACSSLASLKFVLCILLALIRLMLAETNVNCSAAVPFGTEERLFAPFKLLMATTSRFCLSRTCYCPVHKQKFNFKTVRTTKESFIKWKVEPPFALRIAGKSHAVLFSCWVGFAWHAPKTISRIYW